MARERNGRAWIQQPFPYQGKCLRWLREARLALSAADREFVISVLKSTGATIIFSASV